MMTLEQHLAAHALYYDEMAKDCNVCGCGWRIDGEALDYSDRCDTAQQVAELHAAHVAETWREARTVRTVEELDALPVGSVIQDAEDEVLMALGPRRYQMFGEQGEVGRARIEFPVRVLHRPDEDDAA